MRHAMARAAATASQEIFVAGRSGTLPIEATSIAIWKFKTLRSARRSRGRAFKALA